MGNNSNALPEEGAPCLKCGKGWKFHALIGMSEGSFNLRCGHGFDANGADPNMTTVARLIGLKNRVVELEKELLDKEEGFKVRLDIFETSLRDTHNKALALKETRIAELEKGILESVGFEQRAQHELADLRRKLKDVEKERDLAVSSNKLMQQDAASLRAQIETANHAKAKAEAEAVKWRGLHDQLFDGLKTAFQPQATATEITKPDSVHTRTTQSVVPAQITKTEDEPNEAQAEVGSTTDVEDVDSLDDRELDDLRVRSMPVLAHPPRQKCTADCDKHALVSAQFVLKDGTAQAVAYCDEHLADGEYLADMVDFLQEEAVGAPESIEEFRNTLNASRNPIPPQEEVTDGEHDGL